MAESKTKTPRKQPDIKDFVTTSPIYGGMYRMEVYNKNTGNYIDDEFDCGLFDDGFHMNVPGINDPTTHKYEWFHLVENTIVSTLDGTNICIDIPTGRVYLGDYILVPVAESKPRKIGPILLAIAFVVFMIIKLVSAIWY